MNTQVLSDKMLLNRYLTGDRSAISQLIGRHSNRVRDYIRMMVKDHDLADDILQDTLIKVVRVIDEGRYADSGKFLSWVLRIAHNQVIDHFRSQRNARTVSEAESGYDVLGTLRFADATVEDRMVAEQIEADSLTLLAHLTAPATAQKYGFTREEFIGMFIPNTYQVWWNISPEALTDRMAKEYDKFWTSERTAALARTRLSKKEVINLASIVYEETKVVSEMPKIAGVYINRLRRGMPLQACPTAKYAVGDFTLKRILYKHTQVESPYNTYKHRGLPPGPICMPSIAAIDAVLGYADHKWLYFCAKEDLSGRHNFASTLAEHNRNSRRYNEALKRK